MRNPRNESTVGEVYNMMGEVLNRNRDKKKIGGKNREEPFCPRIAQKQPVFITEVTAGKIKSATRKISQNKYWYVELARQEKRTIPVL